MGVHVNENTYYLTKWICPPPSNLLLQSQETFDLPHAHQEIRVIIVVVPIWPKRLLAWSTHTAE